MEIAKESMQVMGGRKIIGRIRERMKDEQGQVISNKQ